MMMIFTSATLHLGHLQHSG